MSGQYLTCHFLQKKKKKKNIWGLSVHSFLGKQLLLHLLLCCLIGTYVFCSITLSSSFFWHPFPVPPVQAKLCYPLGAKVWCRRKGRTHPTSAAFADQRNAQVAEMLSVLWEAQWCPCCLKKTQENDGSLYHTCSPSKSIFVLTSSYLKFNPHLVIS